METKMSKITTLQKAVETIENGSTVAIGGNVLHRAPMALVREIVRQKKRDLAVVKTAGAMDVDVLCFAGCVRSVDAGFISYETKHSLANHYRKAVQEGIVRANEHACYTVISALRAAQAGVPFMPVRGLMVSDLIERNAYFTKIQDPFGYGEVTVVKAIAPDYALIHVQEADEDGNAVIDEPVFEDVLMAKASKNVILSAEKIVSNQRLRRVPERVRIPHFLVGAVVPVEYGAKPCSCFPQYPYSEKEVERFKALKELKELDEWLSGYESADYMQRGWY